MSTTYSFSAPQEVHTFDGLLFDMDGTIIDSTDAIVKYWHKIAKELNVDPAVILATSHGRRSIDILQDYDPSKANWEYVSAQEGLVPHLYGTSATALPGARSLLAALESARAPWAIVTSGTRPLVTGWLDVLGLAHPANMVTAEEVLRGKPDPACYALGARRLGFGWDGVGESGGRRAEMCVFEDAPAGVRAGKAAGFRVVGVVSSHTVEQLRGAGADWIVRDLSSVGFEGFVGGEGEGRRRVRVSIKDALV